MNKNYFTKEEIRHITLCVRAFMLEYENDLDDEELQSLRKITAKLKVMHDFDI
jgi:hypothetical protein